MCSSGSVLVNNRAANVKSECKIKLLTINKNALNKYNCFFFTSPAIRCHLGELVCVNVNWP